MELKDFIENSNAFEVMGVFRKQGILTKEDVEKAATMDRQGWLKFMKEKAGVEDDDDDEK